MYTASLDEPIRDVLILIKLDETTAFGNLCPLEIGFELSKFDSSGTFRALRIRIQDSLLIKSSGESELRLSSYKIIYISHPEETAREFIYGPGQIAITELTIPIWYASGESESEPFSKLRDLNSTHFTPYLPSTFISKVQSIHLIVNGWVIGEYDVKTAFWKSTTVDWKPFDSPVELMEPWDRDFHGDQPPRGLWSVNLFTSVPEYKGERLW